MACFIKTNVPEPEDFEYIKDKEETIDNTTENTFCSREEAAEDEMLESKAIDDYVEPEDPVDPSDPTTIPKFVDPLPIPWKARPLNQCNSPKD